MFFFLLKGSYHLKLISFCLKLYFGREVNFWMHQKQAYLFIETFLNLNVSTNCLYKVESGISSETICSIFELLLYFGSVSYSITNGFVLYWTIRVRVQHLSYFYNLPLTIIVYFSIFLLVSSHTKMEISYRFNGPFCCVVYWPIEMDRVRYRNY